MKRSLADELYENDDVHEAIAAAARRVARRYRGFIGFDDLKQSGYMWMFERPHRVARELPDPGEDERSRRQQFSRLVRLFERALEGVARGEKAAATGYKVDDEVFYDSDLIERLLPTIWQPNASLYPPQRDGEQRGGGDPAEGNTWPVMVLDIRRAFELADLTLDERTLLKLRHADGLTLEAVARVTETTKETALKRLRRATYEVARALHGIRPLYEPAEED